MKALYSIPLVSSLQILACQGQGSSQAHGLCSQESKAILAASYLLTKQRFSGEFVAAKAHGEDSGDKWNIWIPRVGAEEGVVMPAEGLIEVRKADCTCQWIPQR